MFERFTEKAIKVIMLAQEEARRLGHNYVGTEQILLGLIGEGTGIAAKALKENGMNLKHLREVVQSHIGRGSGFVAVEIPFTPRAKRVLELTWDQARQLGHNYIGTEHLLLGLILEREGIAATVLDELGVDVAQLRGHVIKALEQWASETKARLSPTAVQHRDTLSDFLDFCSDAMIKVITIAQEEARAANSERLEVQHLLLGIIGEGKNDAAKLLLAEKITAPRLREQFKKRCVPSAGIVIRRDIELSRRARVLIDLAWNEARTSQSKVTPESLMLSLLNGDYQFEIRCLQDLELNPLSFKIALMQALGEQVSSARPSETLRNRGIPRHFSRQLADTALKVLLFAQGEVRRSKRFEIENIDILLGLVGDGSSLAAQALQDQGITIDKLRKHLEKLGIESKDRPWVDFLFSRPAEQLLAEAWEIARENKHQFLSAEHLCIALLSEEQLEVRNILQENGVDVDELYLAITAIAMAPGYRAESAAVARSEESRSIESCQPEVSSTADKIGSNPKPETDDRSTGADVLLDFSATARVVINLAEKEARKESSDAIGTEHLLIGLFLQESSLASEALRDQCVKIEELRSMGQQIAGTHKGKSPKDLRFSAHAKEAFEGAFKCAKSLQADEISPTHLLFSLINGQPYSVGRSYTVEWAAHKILKELKVDLKSLREFIFAVEPAPYRTYLPAKKDAGTKPVLPAAARTYCDANGRFKNYSSDALHAVLIAHDEARKHGHNLVGTEHLLLGLLLEETGKGGRLLRDLRLEADFVRRSIERLNPSDLGLTAVSIPYTVRARNVFELARKGAKFLSARNVDSEHLLLSLLSDQSNMCWEILIQSGIDVRRLRQILLANYPEQVEDDVDLSAATLVAVGDFWPLISVRFTEKLSAVVDSAKKLACEKSGGIATPEILLLALLATSDSIIDQQLHGIRKQSAHNIISALIKMTGTSSEFKVFSPSALQAMHLAFELSRFEGSAWVQSKHLFTALVRGADEGMRELLVAIGVSGGKVDGGVADQVITIATMLTPSGTNMANAGTLLQVVGGTGRNEKMQFSDAAEAVMELAKEEAKAMGHNFIGSEQILLGLMVHGTGLAAQALAAAELNLNSARAETRRIIGSGTGLVGEFPYTPRTHRILELAVQEPQKADHQVFDTEHLLLGILRDGEGVAVRVMENLKIDVVALEIELQQLISKKQT